jgi:L-alanine-DL-glutamate epimerase-like enolase superfamily enzyme
VDVALYDIAAKAAGLPLYQYLGAYRESLPVYASSLWVADPAGYVDQAKQYAARGYPAYKIHPPGPWRVDMEYHEAMREAVGPNYVLMSDPVAEYTLEQAIRVGRHLERLGYHWFEEPFRDFELDKYRKLCAALDIPIAATETTRGGAWGVAQTIKLDAVDIVRADVSWKPGITGTLKIATLAEAHGMNCELHTTTMGPMDIANLHVACAIRNCEYFEMFMPEDVFKFPMKDDWPVDDRGQIHVPQKPGLGIELDWDGIENNCLEHRVSQ